VLGNFIGTNASGIAALGNGVGVSVTGGTGQVIGGSAGTTPLGSCTGACNVISGNTNQGILISAAGSIGAIVQGNYIGTDVTGLTAIPNGTYGVNLSGGTQNNTIGGTTAAAQNVISGNTNTGVYIEGASTASNIVQGNYIGMNAAGTAALGNGSLGVRLVAGANTNNIGGTGGARNVISGNGTHGVEITGTGVTANVVKGNYIGTNPAGTIAMPNGTNGVEIASGATGNSIGGSGSTDGNIISGNGNYGVRVQGAAIRLVSTPHQLSWAISAKAWWSRARATIRSAVRYLVQAISLWATIRAGCRFLAAQPTIQCKGM
jgi:titin